MTSPAKPDQPIRTSRLQWLDVARGVALVAMAIYHLSWDLEMFGYLERGTSGTGPLKWFARSIASSFLVLVGISLVLAHARGIRWKDFRKRLIQITVAAIAISIATYVPMATRNAFIFFGILHHIALASVIGLLFLRVPIVGLIAAALAVIGIDRLVQLSALDTRWLVWTGFGENPPVTNDFVPLFPWFAFVLFGMAIGRIIVFRQDQGEQSEARDWNIVSRALAFLGRHSLITYLVHQPILIACVYLFSLVHPAQPPSPEAREESFFSSCMSTCEPENGETFCVSYCDCALTAFAEKGLLGGPSLSASEMQSRTEPIIAECTRQTLEDTDGN